jgi:hypothetical protein
LVARRKNLLEEIAKSLNRKYPVKVKVIPCDLTSSLAVHELIEYINAEKLVVQVLVNNAGMGDFTLFSDSIPERNNYLIDLNIRAVLTLTRSILPGMVQRGEGFILNVASQAAFTPGPYIAVYAAAKSFILSFSNALAAETNGNNIVVSVLCPGDIPTGFQKNAGLQGYTVQSKLSVDELAAFTYQKFMVEKEWEIIPEETRKTIELMSRTGNRKSISENFYKLRKLLAKKLQSSK